MTPTPSPGGLVGSPLPLLPSGEVERGSDRPPRTRIEGPPP